ncbi:nitronate monooxygenase [Paraburkholderia sp. RAU2J]|uniref:nitronate monooxygenase n=1 Tax=Paraburkholderia sp. RAU2J TaxID=1938810 RepID=UPI0024114F96|nr:nitronate monooxygenase [Paraburkholderia sp. RAU2J]
MLTKALQHSPSCVFLSFGDPRPFAAEIRDAGAALICQVQFLSQIDVALEAGAAAIVVQGTEAGGHGGNRSTFPFVPEAADYLKQRSPETLLVAAGGIADGRGLAAALMLGADAVVVEEQQHQRSIAALKRRAAKRGFRLESVQVTT